MEMQFKNEIKKLADIVVWADNLITAAGFDVEKYKNDAASAYCHVKAHELWKIKTVVLEAIDRHTVYTNALNKDIADKAAKIELMQKEIDGRKEGYYNLKTQMDHERESAAYWKDKYVKLQEENDEIDKDSKTHYDMYKYGEELLKVKDAEIENLKKELDARGEEIRKLEEKVKHQKENLDGINKTLEIRTKENESLIAVRNNQDGEIEAHEAENARLSEKIMKLKDTITELTQDIDNYQSWNKKLSNDHVDEIAKKNKEIEKLKVDLIHEREKNEKLARAHAELENDMRKSYTDIISQSKTICNLKKELDKTCTTKELDLKGHNRREMTLVDELAKKNDEIKKLKEENSYLKSEIKQKQGIISKAYERYSNEIIKTRKDVLEVAYRDIEKDNGYVGFKLYVKNALTEAKGNKNEANEVITDAVRFCFNEWDKTQKENEKTIKKAMKEVMNKKFGYAWETAVRLRSEVDKKRIVDISEGAERILGVSRELFDDAVKALVDDGYQEIIGRIPQATNSYVYMEMHVLASPDVKTKDTANPENIKSLDSGIPCGSDSIE